MKNLKLILILILAAFCFFFFVNCKTTGDGNNNGNNNGSNNGNGGNNGATDEAIIIDHTCTDLSQIPADWINKVKEQLNLHYAHTSHGEQITTGLERLAQANAVYALEMEKSVPLASTYAFWYENCDIPSSTNHLTMMDGQYYDGYCETYVTPDLYWESDYGMTMTRSVLNNFNVNISLWAWCAQQDYYSREETQRYLDRMSQLESEFPDVTFIYLTGNAQSAEQNRLDRNNQIRDYCKENKKILFDFADLDCWYNGEQHTEDGIPTEHPQYNGDQAGHTTYKSCENKAKAFWWLLARIAGWTPSGGTQ